MRKMPYLRLWFIVVVCATLLIGAGALLWIKSWATPTGIVLKQQTYQLSSQSQQLHAYTYHIDPHVQQLHGQVRHIPMQVEPLANQNAQLTVFFALGVDGNAIRGLTRGPDGSLWLTEYHQSRIGRLTPDGQFTEFPLPNSAENPQRKMSSPERIVTGQDGTLWFTTSQGCIERLTPSGQWSSYQLHAPPTFSNYEIQLMDITVAPDGALWFIDSSAVAVGSITPDGSVRQFALPRGPVAFPHLLQLTVGPDKALWFTQRDDAFRNQQDRIERLTSSGQWDEYLFPPSLQPIGITTGPDGHIWIAGASGKYGAFGQFSMPGKIKLFLTTSQGPFRLILNGGEDGTLIYAGEGGVGVGHLTLDGHQIPYETHSFWNVYAITLISETLWLSWEDPISSPDGARIGMLKTRGS